MLDDYKEEMFILDGYLIMVAGCCVFLLLVGFYRCNMRIQRFL